MGLEKSEAGYVIYNRALSDNDENSSFIEASSLGGFGDMDYYDTFGGNNDGSNYIPSIEPGETVTVHIAKVVNKDETDKMYLNLSTSGDSAEFTKEALGIGYVDIRQ